jgi:CheY-like chemotaxis protein
MRVLVVDDHPINRLIALQLLKKLGVKATAVNHGGEAVQAVETENYNLVLMDCEMPTMDGYAATKAIRALPGPASSVTIIAMTAHAQEDEQARCLAHGMNDYLPKPFRLHQLQDTLTRWRSVSDDAKRGPSTIGQDGFWSAPRNNRPICMGAH